MYQQGEYDMAGFAVGLVDNDEIIDGASIHVGNQIVGLASSGIHSNGYSLVRRIVIDQLQMKPDSFIEPCNCTAADELLKPTRIYVDPVAKILRQFQISGMVHITGGGFYDNIPRILPKACAATIFKGSWPVPPIFGFLQEKGNVTDEEMYHVFNNGIGYIMVTEPDETQEIIGLLNAMGQQAYRIGEIIPREGEASPVRIVDAKAR